MQPRLYLLLLVILPFSVWSQSPVISSFTPGSAGPGTAVTITGTGFNTTAANNFVYFGAVKASVTSASSTSLVVTVPVGATFQPISIIDTSTGLVAFSKPFIPTYTLANVNTAIPNVSGRTEFTTGTTPYGSVLADFDGDGKLDVVVASNATISISVFRNTSSTGTISASSFGSKQDFSTGTNPIGVAAGDLDGDGKLDLVVTNNGSANLSVYHNTSTSGTISFDAKVDFTTGTSPYGVAINDLNLDGKADIVVCNNGSTSFSIFKNKATKGTLDASSFEAKADVTTNAAPSFISIADMDNNGYPDILVGSSSATSVSCFRNTTSSTATITIATKVDMATNGVPHAFVLGDLDGDGKIDVVAPTLANFISVFRNTNSAVGSVSFSTKVDIATLTKPMGACLSDINGDGKLDIMVANNTSNYISIYPNTATSGALTTSSFSAKTDFQTTTNPWSIAAGDIDGDGKIDIVTANAGASSFSVFQNTPQLLPPTISAMSNQKAKVGESVTLTGTNFNTTAANNKIYFGGVQGTVTAATSTSITATIPAGGSRDHIRVLNTDLSLMGTSFLPHMPVFDGSSYMNYHNFSAPTNFTTGNTAYGIASGDLDGDGKPEIVVANYVSATISVFSNTSSAGAINSASFAAKVDFTTGNNPYGVAIGDIDNDGKQDIVVTNYGSATVSVFRNNTTGTGAITASSFAAKVDFTTIVNPIYVAIGDLDGDGKQEMAVAQWQDGSAVSIYRNTSNPGIINSGSFASPTVTCATRSAAHPSYLALADLNGDLKKDIVLCVGGNFGINVYENLHSSGPLQAASFGAKVTLATSAEGRGVTVADVNGDGKPDIIATNYSLSTVSVYANVSNSGTITTSSFANKVDFTMGGNPTYIWATDLNGDEKIDLVAGSTGGSAFFSILRNKAATGASVDSTLFETHIDFQSPGFIMGLLVADFDLDGFPDIATANTTNNSFSVLRNSPLYAPPTVTDLTPVSGPVGTSVTITGTNFNTTKDSNIVYFGGLRASLTAASATSISATAPGYTSYSSVTVMNKRTSLVAKSNASFGNTFSSTGYLSGVISFQPKVDFTTGATPLGAAVGDLDGDGRPELVTANSTGATISVFYHAAAGALSSSTYATKVDFVTGNAPTGVAIGDIDGDGYPDIAVSNASSGTVSVYRNLMTSAGAITSASFAAKVDFSVLGGGVLYLQDMNADGKPDLVVASASTGVSILRNTAVSGVINSTSFAAYTSFTVAGTNYSIAVGDIDGDTKPDIVAAQYSTNNIGIFRNTAIPGAINAYSFSTRLDLSTGTGPRSVGLTDLDGDGKLDIVVANYTSSTVSVFKNIASSGSLTAGSFESKVDYSVGANPFVLSFGDLDGNGKPDIVCSSNTGRTVTVLKNTHTSGSFAAASFDTQKEFAVGTAANAVLVADVDADGKPDLIASNGGSTSLSILKNTLLIASPSITTVSPLTGNVGASITISGSNFNTNADSNYVYFGATKASVTAASTTSLTATLPAGSTYQPLTVTDASTTLSANSLSPVLAGYTNTAYSTASINMSTKVDFTTGSTPLAVVFADIDRDGKPDMITANSGAATISVFRNTSTSGTISSSSFAAKVDFSVGSTPGSLIPADLDGDGKLDLVVANSVGATISLLQNQSVSGTISSSSFAAKVDLTTAATPNGVAVSDLDGDGKPEIVVANGGATSVSVFRNAYTGGAFSSSMFAAKVDFTSGSAPYGVALGDFDGDGQTDIAVANAGSNSISVFRYKGTKGTISSTSFAAKVDFSVGTTPKGLAAVDIDADGKTDLVVINNGATFLSVLKNTGTSGSITSGSFAAKVDFTTITSPYNIAVADFNGDSKPDLAVCYLTGSKVSLFRNTSVAGTIDAQSLAGKLDFTVVGLPKSVTAGDIDGDGKADVAVAYASAAGVVSVLRNDPIPAITGSSAICLGASTTFANSLAGGTWSSSDSAIATISATGVVSTIVAGTVNIGYTVLGQTVYKELTVGEGPTITTQPNATSQTFCLGTTATALEVVASASGATVQTYEWYLNTIATASGGTAIASSNNSSYTPATSSLGTSYYYVKLTSNLGCVTTSAVSGAVLTGSGSVGGTATATDTTLNTGSSTTISLTGYTGTIQWQESTDNTSWNNVSGGSGATSNAYTTAALTANSYFRASVTNGTCSASNSSSVSITVTHNHTWTGASNTDWSTAANWNPASVPVSGANLTVPGSLSNYPVLDQSRTVANLTLGSGATLNLGTYTGTVIGTLSNSGTISGTGVLLLEGSSAQTISGTGTIHNLTVNNNAGVTIAVGSHSLSITGTYTPFSGTLTTNGNLVLKSDGNGTARIAEGSSNYISGDVTVERYIGANRRAWRFLSLPVSVSSLRSAWAGVSANPAAPAGELAGNGTLITGHRYTSGALAASAGFDWFTGLGTYSYSSIRFYDGVNDNWTSATNTPSLTTTPDKPAYMLYVRGDRTVAGNIEVGNTTLRPKGPLKLGTQLFTINNTFEPIGNPYPSSIDLDAVYNNSGNSAVIERNFWVWDATQGTIGGFVALSYNGSNYVATPGGTDAANLYMKIESGQGFFVEKKTEGTLTISENNKTGSNGYGVFAVTTPITGKVGSINLGLLQSGKLMDGVTLQFNDNYRISPTESYDVDKLNNFNENLSLVNENSYLSVDSRPYPVLNDTLRLCFWNLTQSTYSLKLNSNSIGNRIGYAVLVDRFTNARTPIDLTGASTNYSFKVTGDTASNSLSRFSIIISTQAGVASEVATLRASGNATGITLSWLGNQDANLIRYEIERSADGINFEKIGLAQAMNQISKMNYSWLDQNPITGTNSYRIKLIFQDGSYKYSPMANANWNSKSDIELLPTITSDGKLTLVMRNQATGIYRVNLYGANGARLYSKQINKEQSVSIYDLQLTAGGTQLVQGVYFLELTDGVGLKKQFKILKK